MSEAILGGKIEHQKKKTIFVLKFLLLRSLEI